MYAASLHQNALTHPLHSTTFYSFFKAHLKWYFQPLALIAPYIPVYFIQKQPLSILIYIYLSH